MRARGFWYDPAVIANLHRASSTAAQAGIARHRDHPAGSSVRFAYFLRLGSLGFNVRRAVLASRCYFSWPKRGVIQGRKSMSYLRKGVSGEPVRLLQAKLGVPADGAFGPATEAALKAFQQKHGLAVDGVAGPDTFLSLGLGELVLLAPGARGEAVKKLQLALGIPADGQFGPATQKAVSTFQAANGLDADGLAGPKTLIKIAAFAAQISPAQAEASSPEIVASSAADPEAPATLPSIEPGAPPTPAPKTSIWAKLRGWL
jgi:peptidoglycan hydrolase-like protein with peptidoglycan-binding domain